MNFNKTNCKELLGKRLSYDGEKQSIVSQHWRMFIMESMAKQLVSSQKNNDNLFDDAVLHVIPAVTIIQNENLWNKYSFICFVKNVTTNWSKSTFNFNSKIFTIWYIQL